MSQDDQSSPERERDEILRRLLKTPPKPREKPPRKRDQSKGASK
jgi:hypothetical protein